MIDQPAFGADIDGVFANFVAGVKMGLAKAKIKPKKDLDSINWDEQGTFDIGTLIGLTSEEEGLLWDAIKSIPYFWLVLPTLKEIDNEVSAKLTELCEKAPFFFITAREPAGGLSIYRQTMLWLEDKVFHDALPINTSIIVVESGNNKKELIKLLGLDAFIEDKPETLRSLVNTEVKIFSPKVGYANNIQGVNNLGVKAFLDYCLSKV